MKKIKLIAILTLIFWAISWGTYYYLAKTNPQLLIDNWRLSIVWFYGTPILIMAILILSVYFLTLFGGKDETKK